MSKFKHTFCATMICIFLHSCAKKGDSWEFAVNPGAYSLSGPHCVSTNETPNYPSIAQRINLFDFDNLQSYTFKIDGANSTRTITDADCKLTIDQPIHENRNGTFALKLSKLFKFEPEGCTLSVSAENGSFEAGANSTEGLKDRDDANSDIPFEIRAIDNGFEMISANDTELNDLWGEYGCATPDRVKWVGQKSD